ncbi:MAG TPA: pitrilysin family protein [Patescibacteria group bacterium]|jgi:predicted Zn-dependent peptidase|nr:pitrilysin family protein [Patescibacteria group bacterium]
MKYYKKVLKNGLTIIEVPSNDAESVVVDFFVKTGSRSETAKENGISHFLEHFLFKGTTKFPSSMAITELIDGIGGEMNANTGKEHTQYFIKGRHTHLELIFEVLTDMLLNPLLDKEELEREKGVIVEEINMYRDTPRINVGNILEEVMWQGDPLGRDIAGTPEVVKKLTQNMFTSYMSRNYQPGNMLLGISGKYDRVALNRLINKYWSKLPAKKWQKWPKAKDSQRAPRVRIEFKDTKQAHFNIGFKGYNVNDKKNAAANVLSAILGGGMSSRLFSEIRERRGLAYYVRAGNGQYQDTGVFDVSAGIRVSNIEEALKVTMDVLKDVKSILVTEKELVKAKSYLKGRTTLYLEDNQARLDWYLEQAAFSKKTKSPAEAFKEIDGVTAKQVQAVAKELFQPSKISLAIIGPYRSDKKFANIISKI